MKKILFSTMLGFSTAASATMSFEEASKHALRYSVIIDNKHADLLQYAYTHRFSHNHQVLSFCHELYSTVSQSNVTPELECLISLAGYVSQVKFYMSCKAKPDCR